MPSCPVCHGAVDGTGNCRTAGRRHTPARPRPRPTPAPTPQCGECGHTMSKVGANRFLCIENTCSIGLAVLGDFASARRRREAIGGFVHA